MSLPIDYGVATCIGAVVGIAELVARYKDDPRLAISSLPGVSYILINATVSAGMLFLLQAFHIDSASLGDPEAVKQHAVTQVLLAGFSAMALLRSSIFKIRVRNQDVRIGVAAIIDTLLQTIAERSTDGEAPHATNQCR